MPQDILDVKEKAQKVNILLQEARPCSGGPRIMLNH